MGEFIAHLSISDKRKIQTVSEHCRKTGEYASIYLNSIGLGETGYIAGILHDAGKYTEKFNNYICKAVENPDSVQRGSVNHTFAGVKYVLENFSNKDEPVWLVARDVIAYAIGAHHGVFDCMDENKKNGFEYRCSKEDINYEEAMGNYLTDCANKEELHDYFEKSVVEIRNHCEKILRLGEKQVDQNKQSDEINFYIGCLSRMILSAVIDSDRRDTAEFFNGIKYPNSGKNMRHIWRDELENVEKKINTFDNSSDINKARMIISNKCKEASFQKEGLFRLSVPTGAGKTISSLRFALSHAEKYGKSRIIFVSPLLSILEQNADVVRSFILDQSLILEHHSNALQPETRGDELNLNELYIDNWESPIIITTLVQLLDTFFAGKMSNIRRFHSLSDSIIVIDEVQSVPNKLLTLFNLMISYLCECCKATVVLCTATQPYLEGADHPIALSARNMVPYDKKIWNCFKRTTIKYAGNCKTTDLSKRILELAGSAKSVLVICNKKNESESLYKELALDYCCYHLSASMCMQHRRIVLNKIKEELKKSDDDSAPLICISTQVLEAGVHISFECVIRLLAGIDKVVQADGRCNRDGEMKTPGTVYMLNCTDENLTMLDEIKREKDAAIKLIQKNERYGTSFTSEESVKEYYKFLYGDMKQKYQDFNVDTANYSIFQLLSSNTQFFINDNTQLYYKYMLHQAFKMAYHSFHVFDENTMDVIVPYEKGKDIISDLSSQRAEYDHNFVLELLKQAKGYTVTLYPYQKHRLESLGAIMQIKERDVWILCDGYYDEYVGITMNGNLSGFLEG